MFMIPAHVFHVVAPQWREDLVRFIDTGDASDAFLDHLDSNDECQRVVELCLALVTQDLVQLAKAEEEEPQMHIDDNERVLASTLASTINRLLALDSDQRRQVLSRLGPQAQVGLHMALHDFDVTHGRSTTRTM